MAGTNITINSGQSGGGGGGAVDSVNGKTGVVTITKSDIGLSNINNTSDLNKPISTATQNSLNSINNDLSNLTDNVDTLQGDLSTQGTRVDNLESIIRTEAQIRIRSFLKC